MKLPLCAVLATATATATATTTATTATATATTTATATATGNATAHSSTHEYDCYMCALTVQHASEQQQDQQDQQQHSLLSACHSLFGAEVCRDFDVFRTDFPLDTAALSHSHSHSHSLTLTEAREVCRQNTAPGTCSDLSDEAWRQSPGYHGDRLTRRDRDKDSDGATSTQTTATATVMDVRVSKAYGSRVNTIHCHCMYTMLVFTLYSLFCY